MRPRRLELEGFSTFKERVVLDFEGLDLVAFTGPTGAGKSTLIDAITFALYGSVARYENAGRVAPVIHQLVNQARVRLDFETGGRTYIATRVVKRRSTRAGDSDSASTREARLELVDTANPEAETTILAGDVKELNASVEELLGLDFRQFTRTIVLPQGEFASFLRDEPANRDRLLQRLLDLGIYERVGQLARSRAKKSGYQAEILAEQLQRNPAVTDDEFERLTDRVTVLEQLRSDGKAKLSALAELDARLDPLRDEVRHIDQALARLKAVEVPDDLAGLDRQLGDAAETRSKQQQVVAAARTERDRALARLDDLVDKGQIVKAISLVEQLAEAKEKVEDLELLATEVAEAVKTLTVEQQTVETAVAAAENAATTARRAADAAGWTATLVVGDPCPVCHRDVEAIPDHDAAHEMEMAEKEQRRLEGEARSISKKLAKADARKATSAEEIERQSERIDLLELQLSTLPDARDLPELNRQLEAVERAEQHHRVKAGEAAEAEAELQTMEQAEAAVADALASMRSTLASHRDSVADLEPPPLQHESLLADYQLLHHWSLGRVEQLDGDRAGLAEEGKRVAAERAGLTEQLNNLADGAGVDPDVATLAQSLTEAVAASRSRVTAAEQRRADHQQLSAQIAELEQDRTLNAEVGKHLRSGGFGSWLLSEALDNIVAKATGWLLGLSGNQYSLIVGDKNFSIIDHNNADETRDVRTLSGGETFLASLALALALADSIAELAPVDAPRLESMFLDEGFGTLDPGTLDVVAGAIEELASTGRMIGIVTHVNDLAERMPARFEVTKGPATSSVELVET